MKYVSYFVALNHKNYNWLWTRLKQQDIFFGILSGSQEQSESWRMRRTWKPTQLLQSGVAFAFCCCCCCLFMAPRYTATTTELMTWGRDSGGGSSYCDNAVEVTPQGSQGKRDRERERVSWAKMLWQNYATSAAPWCVYGPQCTRCMEQERVDELGAPQSGDNALCRTQ